MMQIRNIASGSKGNCTLLIEDDIMILLDCGVKLNKIEDAVWNEEAAMRSINACLLTHEHSDHSRAIQGILSYNIPCFMSPETMEKLKLKRHVFPLNDGDIVHRGYMTIVAFNVHHDVPCTGYMITTNKSRVVYITDYAYSHYKFPDTTHYILGCNYDEETLMEGIESGETDRAQVMRVMNVHPSLNTVSRLLRANDLSKLVEVHLIHISDHNANREKIEDEVRRITGREVYLH